MPFTRTKSVSHICHRRDRPSLKRKSPKLLRLTQKQILAS